ncbi:hypothetical protein BG61_16715 [Caballeronia glathei]|uniref:Uncharacterized protein n=1 Tax=Caballeronia glathei TaxID=60547 RepID=A0A069PNT4_9BURK|nr:hypothetical protein BG61_16715 [Caballeronia glathei]
MTLIPFTPNNLSSPPFSTQLTLDGGSFVGNVTWNIAGQRWYLSILDSSGTMFWSGAMVGSPLGFDIFLAPGVFSSSTILFRADTGNFEIVP